MLMNCIHVIIFNQAAPWPQINGKTCFEVVIVANKLGLPFLPLQTVGVLNLIKVQSWTYEKCSIGVAENQCISRTEET